MEHAQLGACSVKQPTRQLERISLAVERVARAQYLVGEFTERFNGPSPESVGGSGADAVPVGYRDNLNRLFASLDQLENSIAALNEIG